MSSKIVSQPTGPSVFHSEFDNFDQLVNSLSGGGSVHTAHGIMLQEVDVSEKLQDKQLPSVLRVKERSWKGIEDKPLEDVFVSQRKSPLMNIITSEVPGSWLSFTESQKHDLG